MGPVGGAGQRSFPGEEQPVRPLFQGIARQIELANFSRQRLGLFLGGRNPHDSSVRAQGGKALSQLILKRRFRWIQTVDHNQGGEKLRQHHVRVGDAHGADSRAVEPLLVPTLPGVLDPISIRIDRKNGRSGSGRKLFDLFFRLDAHHKNVAVLGLEPLQEFSWSIGIGGGPLVCHATGQRGRVFDGFRPEATEGAFLRHAVDASGRRNDPRDRALHGRSLQWLRRRSLRGDIDNGELAVF